MSDIEGVSLMYHNYVEVDSKMTGRDFITES